MKGGQCAVRCVEGYVMQCAAGTLSAVQRCRNTGGYVIFPEPLLPGEKKPASISVSPLHLQGRGGLK